MSKNYYTNAVTVGSNILFRGIKEGRRVKEKIQYSPTFYLPTKKVTDFKTLQDEYLEPKTFETIRDARDFMKRYDEVENFKVYGNSRYEYAYIADTHKGMIDWDIEDVLIAVIDIEVGSENGFPDPYQANEPITAITMSYLNGETLVYACGEYQIKGEEKYIKCSDEYQLCLKFLRQWYENCPDVLSGWNTKGFDIPYIINRFRKILGEDMTKKLSPWNIINERNSLGSHGKEMITYTILGVSSLDYLDLYKAYSPDGKSQESYRLGYIAEVELGENKISYDEYDNLHQLYRLNFQKFIEYNIHDVRLILRLDDKLKLFELALTLAYDTKSNYEDIFTQTRMWDALTYNNLLEKNIIVPPSGKASGADGYEGAYVKVPQVGVHDWVASFDLNSLYPHLMMQYNISVETLIQPEDYTHEMHKIISEGVTVEKLLNQKINLDYLKDKKITLTPNGQFFRTDKQGFLAKMMEDMYEDRKKFKKMMLQAKQEYENEKDSTKKYDIEKRIARYNNLQLAKKLALNSAYGTMGSQYFRFYDVRLALAITTAGQLSIKWIENKINQYLNGLLKTDTDYVIAVDTDSTYLRLGDLVNKVYGVDGVIAMPKQKVIDFMDRVCEDKLQPYIDKSYQELAEYVNAYAQKMQMKREALADKGIWTAKKRYILNVYNNEGVQYAEPYVKVTGLEMIKSSTPSAVREKMKESIKIMISGTEEDMHKFIEDFRKQFNSLPVEDISFPRGMNGLDNYTDNVSLYKKGTPIHVKGAIIYNHYLKQMKLTKKYPLIQEGEKVKFTYLKVPNPFKDTVISFTTRLPKEFNIQEFIDYDTQFEKTFVEPLKVILNCMNWHTEKQNTLESFFG
jgi:DNA polymerase elongation subunit (family B)